MKAIQIEALRKLDSIELKVLETAAEQLGGNVARLDYTEIARAVGTSRQAYEQQGIQHRENEF